MNQLVDERHLVEGLRQRGSHPEDAKYDIIDFDLEVYRKDLGAPGRLMHGDDKKKALLALEVPSLPSGIQEPFLMPAPRRLSREGLWQVSVRIVPDQTVRSGEDGGGHCNKVWASRDSPNKMTASSHGGRCSSCSDPDHPIT